MRNSRSPSPSPFPRDCKWSTINPEKYKVEVESIEFFDPNLVPDATPPVAASYYLRYVLHAHEDDSQDRSSLDDFIVATLKLTGFEERCTTIQCGYLVGSTCDDGTTESPLQVCLFHQHSLILLLACRPYYDWEREAVKEIFITQAIAACRHNNAKRTEKGLKPLDAMIFPCISIYDLKPTFYLIPVTAELSRAVAHGESPSTTTTIYKGDIPMPTGAKWRSMDDPTYRQFALACFKKFRCSAKRSWEQFLQGFA
ncbi:hypothetical protein H0H92_014866 [Tricholoma furcatifolium]|nr:hypothetical protein H0H92_014866 [Tricholoma furcatifolium]